ncbi:MAG: DUF2061 domain-containing protein [Gammaproteobacteria bacterium]|nr:DUF2061 domain-containing protein [Gammaproteobacteria bacterium]
MKESHLRSLIKAISWRIFATFLTVVISYMITHRISFAIYIGMFEFLSKIIFFYLHERLWENISFGIRVSYHGTSQ